MDNQANRTGKAAIHKSQRNTKASDSMVEFDVLANLAAEPSAAEGEPLQVEN